MLLMRRAISACTRRVSGACAGAASRSVRWSRATISALRRARSPSARMRSSRAGGGIRWLEAVSAGDRGVAAIVVADLEAVGARRQAADDADHLAVGAAGASAEAARDRRRERRLARRGQDTYPGLGPAGAVVGDDARGLSRGQLDEGAPREDADRLDELRDQRRVEGAAGPLEELQQRFL